MYACTKTHILLNYIDSVHFFKCCLSYVIHAEMKIGVSNLDVEMWAVETM